MNALTRTAKVAAARVGIIRYRTHIVGRGARAERHNRGDLTAVAALVAAATAGIAVWESVSVALVCFVLMCAGCLILLALRLDWWLPATTVAPCDAAEAVLGVTPSRDDTRLVPLAAAARMEAYRHDVLAARAAERARLGEEVLAATARRSAR